MNVLVEKLCATYKEKEIPSTSWLSGITAIWAPASIVRM